MKPAGDGRASVGRCLTVLRPVAGEPLAVRSIGVAPRVSALGSDEAVVRTGRSNNTWASGRSTVRPSHSHLERQGGCFQRTVPAVRSPRLLFERTSRSCPSGGPTDRALSDLASRVPAAPFRSSTDGDNPLPRLTRTPSPGANSPLGVVIVTRVPLGANSLVQPL